MSYPKSFYAIACSLEEKGGIYRYECSENSQVKEVDFTPLKGCSYLVFDHSKSFAYASFNLEEGGGVAAFKVNSDLSLTLLNSCESQGLSTCHVATDKSRQYLYCANYTSGSFTEFELAPNGTIKELTKVTNHHGSGPNLARQTSAHVHQTMLTPDGNFLSIIDLGTDEAKLYALTESGVDTTQVTSCKITAGAGPRHVVFNSSGDTAYLLNELGNSVSRLSYSNGSYTLLSTWETLPSSYAGFSKASAIRLSLDGKFLLASNRGCDTIAVFKVLANGDLERISIEFAWGESPRDFDFIADGSLVAITNENNDNMSICAFDSSTGKITPTGQFFELPRPLCILRID